MCIRDRDNAIRPHSVSFFKALVLDAKNEKPIQSDIKITEVTSNESFYSGTTSDDGSALICIPKGDRYGIQLYSKGYIFISDYVHIPDSGTITAPYKATYKMEKIGDARGKSFILKNIFFESGSAVLKATSLAEIDAIYRMMKDDATLVIQIDGYTDNVGAEKDNLFLSHDRAKAVADVLTKRGISVQNIISKGYGESKPIADNETEAGRQKNRRTEFTIK